MTTTLVKDLDINKIQFSNKMPMNNGGYMCYVNNPSLCSGKWYMQTPIMKAPFGLSKVNPFGNPAPKPGEQPKVSLWLSFGASRDPDVAACHKKMKELDEFMLSSAVSNSVDWFGKQCSKDILDEKYNKCVRSPNKPPTDGRAPFPDSMPLKIYCRGSGDDINPVDDLKLYEWDVDNDKCTQVDSSSIWDVIHKQSEVQVIFRINMVYFVGKQSWGLTMRAETIRYIPKMMQPTGASQFLKVNTLLPPVKDDVEEGELADGEEYEEEEYEEVVEYV